MKKILVFIFGILMLSGCSLGTRKLTCTNFNKDTTIISNETLILYYKKANLKSYDLSISLKALSDETKDYLVFYKTSFETLEKELSKVEGITIKSSKTADSFTFNMNHDLKIATQKAIEKKLGYTLTSRVTYDYEDDIETIKKDLESKGYTCK